MLAVQQLGICVAGHMCGVVYTGRLWSRLANTGKTRACAASPHLPRLHPLLAVQCPAPCSRHIGNT